MTDQEMSPEVPMGGDEATSDDRLWAALAYVFTPLVPIIILLLDDKKNRPYIRAHNAQALAWGIVYYVVTVVTTPVLIGFCIGPIGFLVQLYFAYKAFSGEMIEIPVISDFVRNQGWA